MFQTTLFLLSNNQYMIPAIISFGIFVLICATDCPASIVQPIKEIQEELEQKDQLIVELKTQLNESLTLNEKLNKENLSLPAVPVQQFGVLFQ